MSFLTGQKHVRKGGLRFRRTSFDSTAVIDKMEHFLVPHPRLLNDKLEALDPLCFGKPLDISDVPQSSKTSPLRQAHLEALMCKQSVHPVVAVMCVAKALMKAIGRN